MKVVYMSDDGKTFDNKYDCMDYEWLLYHPNVKFFVGFYDKNSKELKNIISEDTYQNTDMVIVTNKAAIADLHALAEYTGFCNYSDIIKSGIWLFNKEKGRFIEADYSKLLNAKLRSVKK